MDNKNFINCSAHGSSDGNLLIGSERTALFECGMAFCAESAIRNVKKALGGRTLDYIFITHAHYDHTGALPFFKAEWPGAKLAASAASAAILQKDTPRRVFREMSAAAAKAADMDFNGEYDDELFRADIILSDGDAVKLGGVSVTVLETPGHTRDSVSYYVPEQKLLILCETPGVLMPDGSVCPCFLTGYKDTLNSIDKCRATGYKYLSLPHRGLTTEAEADGFFERAYAANVACREMITDMINKNLNENEMLDMFFENYGAGVRSGVQPMEAFTVNARAMFACIKRESNDETV